MAAATTYAKIDEGTERSSEEGKEGEEEPANAAEDNGTEVVLPKPPRKSENASQTKPKQAAKDETVC